jgi:hypothetical protein
MPFCVMNFRSHGVVLLKWWVHPYIAKPFADKSICLLGVERLCKGCEAGPSGGQATSKSNSIPKASKIHLASNSRQRLCFLVAAGKGVLGSLLDAVAVAVWAFHGVIHEA